MTEIECNVGSVFTNALGASQYEGFSRLLLPHLLSSLRSKPSSELVTSGLLGEFDLGPFESLRWDECLRALPPDQRTDVREWLQAWHEVVIIYHPIVTVFLTRSRKIASYSFDITSTQT